MILIAHSFFLKKQLFFQTSNYFLVFTNVACMSWQYYYNYCKAWPKGLKRLFHNDLDCFCFCGFAIFIFLLQEDSIKINASYWMFPTLLSVISTKCLDDCAPNVCKKQRWSPRGRSWPRGRPRGQILKSLASKPQVIKNCPVLGSRTAPFFEPLKICWKAPETLQKICEDLFLFFSSGNLLKKNF